MSFTNPQAAIAAPSVNDILQSPAPGYHYIDSVRFGHYSPVMPVGGVNPNYRGGVHPQAQVVKTQSPVGQNLYSIYGNPDSAYFQNTIGQR